MDHWFLCVNFGAKIFKVANFPVQFFHGLLLSFTLINYSLELHLKIQSMSMRPFLFWFFLFQKRFSGQTEMSKKKIFLRILIFFVFFGFHGFGKTCYLGMFLQFAILILSSLLLKASIQLISHCPSRSLSEPGLDN